MVQRAATRIYAIVDEVDSILIDEARTPLIISGPVEDRSDLYIAIDALIPKLARSDFELDEKQRQVALTEAGNEHIEELLRDAGLLKGDSLYDIENVTIVHHVNQALKAHKLFQRDRDYIVKNGQVVIIDEFTGRMMAGPALLGRPASGAGGQGARRDPAREPDARLDHLPELLPPLRQARRHDRHGADRSRRVHATSTARRARGADQRADGARRPTTTRSTARPRRSTTRSSRLSRTASKRSQPVLVGTISIEKSRDAVGAMLKARGIPHQVLNARYHEQEAYIIAQAGVPGAVTIATNMAGRGTDIQLGGNLEMRVCKDWHSPRARSASADRRIEARDRANREIVLDARDDRDRAAKARAASAHAPAASMSSAPSGTRAGASTTSCAAAPAARATPAARKFFLSLEDDLMRIFGSDRMDGMLQKLGLKEGEAIIHPWINKALENAQKKVEARNFDIRKYVLKYDDVMNDQRKVIFEQRIELMDEERRQRDGRRTCATRCVRRARRDAHPRERLCRAMGCARSCTQAVKESFGLDLPIDEWADEEGIADQEIRERLINERRREVRQHRRAARHRGSHNYDNAKSLVAFVEASPTSRRCSRRSRRASLDAAGRFILASGRRRSASTAPIPTRRRGRRHASASPSCASTWTHAA